MKSLDRKQTLLNLTIFPTEEQKDEKLKEEAEQLLESIQKEKTFLVQQDLLPFLLLKVLACKAMLAKHPELSISSVCKLYRVPRNSYYRYRHAIHRVEKPEEGQHIHLNILYNQLLLQFSDLFKQMQEKFSWKILALHTEAVSKSHQKLFIHCLLPVLEVKTEEEKTHEIELQLQFLRRMVAVEDLSWAFIASTDFS